MNDNAVWLLDRGATIAGKPCSHRPLLPEAMLPQAMLSQDVAPTDKPHATDPRRVPAVVRHGILPTFVFRTRAV
ncbi:hypothetical protein CVG87_09090 [Pseudomonas sp. WCS365]|nr:hypothetical protein CVG87_09090 [Pseudomonas sp. WCS365]